MTIFDCLGDAESTAEAEIKAVYRPPPDPAYIVFSAKIMVKKREAG